MKKKIVIVGVILLLLTAVIGVSYAAFSYSQTGSYENTITTGEISMSYDETSKVINMSGALPTTDATGKASLVEGEYFDFSVTTHIVGDTNINWEISAKELDSNTFDGSNVRLYLTRLEDGEEVQVMAPTNYSENSTSNSYTGRPSGEMSLLMGSTSQQGDVTINYRLRMWVDEDYNPQGTTGGETFAVEVNVYGLQGSPISAVDTLLAKANTEGIREYDNGNTAEMYTFVNEAGTEQSGWTEEELTDYRYIGNSPNNYVTFNDEMWRIIGVFTVEDENGNKEQRIKIVKNANIGSIAYDTGGSNNWSNASLNTYLNNDYYNSLSSEAQSMILNVKWLDATDDWTKIGLVSAKDILSNSTGYQSVVNQWCNQTDIWYHTSECRNTSWLNNIGTFWLINGVVTNIAGYAYFSNTTSSNWTPYGNATVVPSLYLNSNVVITEGTGTSSDPYILQ